MNQTDVLNLTFNADKKLEKYVLLEQIYVIYIWFEYRWIIYNHLFKASIDLEDSTKWNHN